MRINSLLFLLFFLFMGDLLVAEKWSAPVDVAKDVMLFCSDLAVGPKGNAVALFVHSGDYEVWVEAALRTSGGKWSKPVILSTKTPLTPSVVFGINPRVCITPEGSAVAVWNFPALDGDKEVIQAAILPPNQNKWTKTSTLCAPVELEVWSGPRLVLDKTGNAIVSWGAFYKEKEQDSIESARLQQGALHFESLSPLHIPYHFLSTRMTVDPDNTVWMAWMKSDGNFAGKNVMVSNLSPDSKEWSSPVTIEAEGIDFLYDPAFAVDRKGNILLSFRSVEALGNRHFYAFRLASGTGKWEKTVFSHSVPKYSGWVTLDPEGNALAVWCDDSIPMFSTLADVSLHWTKPTPFLQERFARIEYCTIDNLGNRLLFLTTENEMMLKSCSLPAGSKRWSDPVEITNKHDGYGSFGGCQFLPDGSALLLFENAYWGVLQSATYMNTKKTFNLLGNSTMQHTR